jgi:hypothetical protein
MSFAFKLAVKRQFLLLHQNQDRMRLSAAIWIELLSMTE